MPGQLSTGNHRLLLLSSALHGLEDPDPAPPDPLSQRPHPGVWLLQGEGPCKWLLSWIRNSADLCMLCAWLYLSPSLHLMCMVIPAPDLCMLCAWLYLPVLQELHIRRQLSQGVSKSVVQVSAVVNVALGVLGHNTGAESEQRENSNMNEGNRNRERDFCF